MSELTTNATLDFNCNECEIPLEAMGWIQLVVRNGIEIVVGFVCSPACLVDYTARVMTVEIGDADDAV